MAEMAENEEQAQPPRARSDRGSTLKTLLVLVGVLVLEGGTIGVTMYLAGGPSEVEGVEMDAAAAAGSDRPVEVLVIEDKYPNMRTGIHLLYDTEVFITVREGDREKVTKDLESKQAQVSMAMATIIRSAHPSYFQEATLATLRRQVKAMLDEQLGENADGEPYVGQVLITKCNPFRSGF